MTIITLDILSKINLNKFRIQDLDFQHLIMDSDLVKLQCCTKQFPKVA